MSAAQVHAPGGPAARGLDLGSGGSGRGPVGRSVTTWGRAAGMQGEDAVGDEPGSRRGGG